MGGLPEREQEEREDRGMDLRVGGIGGRVERQTEEGKAGQNKGKDKQCGTQW